MSSDTSDARGFSDLKALRIVEAAESASWWLGGEDHAEAVVRSAFERFAAQLADALGVPPCTCKWGHPHTPPGERPCPRLLIEEGRADG